MQAKSGITPKALQDLPPLQVVNSHYLVDFFEISTFRAVSEVGPQALTVSDIKAYLEIEGIPRHRWSWYRKIFAALDRTYLKLVRKKMAASTV